MFDLYRLRGHKDQITCLHFLYPDSSDTNTDQIASPTHILSSSKDTLLKVWDITTQHCIETIVGHRSEIWSMALTPDGKTLVTGSADSELKIWNIDYVTLVNKLVANSDDNSSQSTADMQVTPKV